MVAGAGTGMMPWAVRTEPLPSGKGPRLQVAGESASISQAAATMSAMESSAPTSWKATSGTGTPCTRASASASSEKMPMA